MNAQNVSWVSGALIAVHLATRVVFGAATKIQENVSDARMVAVASRVKIHVWLVGTSAKVASKAVVTAPNAIREPMILQVGVERLAATAQTLTVMATQGNAKEHACLGGLELLAISLALPHVKNQRFASMMPASVDQAMILACWAHVRNLQEAV